MTLTPAQKSATEEILGTVIVTTGLQGKHQISTMFMDLVDRKAWPHYYEVILELRCLDNIQDGISKNWYKDAKVPITLLVIGVHALASDSDVANCDLFKGSVQSGFLTLKWKDQDWYQSFLVPKIKKTGPELVKTGQTSLKA
ncbi:hypothetical protein JOM56_013170 [Amanita muscaria]